MQFINWIPEYSVQVPKIDEQHKIFIGIMNDMYDALVSLETAGRIDYLILALEAYAGNHFATEEMYFDKFGYEEAVAHKAEHAGYVQKLAEFKGRYLKGDMGIVPEMLDFAEGWLIRHIMSSDKRYTKCFNEHGMV